MAPTACTTWDGRKEHQRKGSHGGELDERKVEYIARRQEGGAE